MAFNVKELRNIIHALKCVKEEEIKDLDRAYSAFKKAYVSDTSTSKTIHEFTECVRNFESSIIEVEETIHKAEDMIDRINLESIVENLEKSAENLD